MYGAERLRVPWLSQAFLSRSGDATDQHSRECRRKGSHVDDRVDARADCASACSWTRAHSAANPPLPEAPRRLARCGATLRFAHLAVRDDSARVVAACASRPDRHASTDRTQPGGIRTGGSRRQPVTPGVEAAAGSEIANERPGLVDRGPRGNALGPARPTGGRRRRCWLPASRRWSGSGGRRAGCRRSDAPWRRSGLAG